LSSISLGVHRYTCLATRLGDSFALGLGVLF